MGQGCPGDWQGLLYRHGIRVLYWHDRDLPDGAFQPAPLHAFPRGHQDLPATDRHPGVNQGKKKRKKQMNFSSIKAAIWWQLGANVLLNTRLRDDGEDTVGCIFNLVMGPCRPWCSQKCRLWVIQSTGGSVTVHIVLMNDFEVEHVFFPKKKLKN